MVKQFLLVLVKTQLVGDQRIALDQLACGKSDGKTRLNGMVLNEVDHRMQGPVDGSAMLVGIAEILSQRFFLILAYMVGVTHQLVDTLVLRC